ncbi:MAG: hypothetical protein WCQ45_02015 [bacterium]
MRMLKVVGMAMLVAAMVVGVAAVSFATVPAASSAVSVNASFSIPSWISLSIVTGGDVGFASITGPGTYNGSNGTQLRVLSTANWSLSNTILWASPSSKMPVGANPATIDASLQTTLHKTSVAWGSQTVNVSYRLVLTSDDLANLPQGDYSLVVQYTVTTN